MNFLTRVRRAPLLAAAIAICAVTAACLSGCGDSGTKPSAANGTGEPGVYAVTVISAGTGSSGGGNYVAGATVAINAGTPPEGKTLQKWTASNNNVIFENANNAVTTFIMPANAVTVTANFEAIPVTPPAGETFTDSRDGKTYRKVTIGTQTWMAENLNYETSSDSWCYADDPANCDTYGRLYDWNTAMTACPVGWHLPTRDEWGTLAKYAGGEGNYGKIGTAGTKLKSSSGWKAASISPVGTDDYGFSALPGGYYEGGSFTGAGSYGYWWTATENDSDDVYFRFMSYNNELVGESFLYDKSTGGRRSVRCLIGNAPVMYNVTVTAGTGATGGGSYEAGTLVTITAGTPPDGKTFQKWTASNNNVIFENANNAVTTFIMPAKAVTVTVVWEDIPVVNDNEFIDNRDGKTYRKVTIGTQTWMAENLNYTPTTGDSWCYENSADSCNKYGRLYDWSTAKTVCPTGWHLPTRDEWGTLAKYAGGEGDYGKIGTAGTKLKSSSGWKAASISPVGTDDYGFSALPGGYYEDGSFTAAGSYGYWWVATVNDSGAVYYRFMSYNNELANESSYDEHLYDWSYGRSVRCFQD